MPGISVNNIMHQQMTIKICDVILSIFVVEDEAGHAPNGFKYHLLSFILYSLRLSNFCLATLMSSFVIAFFPWFPWQSRGDNWIENWFVERLRKGYASIDSSSQLFFFNHSEYVNSIRTFKVVTVAEMNWVMCACYGSMKN